VESWAWTSKPITASYSMVKPCLGAGQADIGFFQPGRPLFSS